VELSGGDRKLNLNIIKQQMSKTIYKITAMKFKVRLARVALDLQIGAFRFVVLLERIFSTEGRGVRLCWEKPKPKGPKGTSSSSLTSRFVVLLERIFSTEGRSVPSMLGEIKT